MYIFFDELLIKNLFNKIILTFRKYFKPNKMKKEREKYNFSSMKCNIIKIKSKMLPILFDIMMKNLQKSI